MAHCRKVPFLTFVISPLRKIKVNLAGCNFNCKGCFAIAKEEIGTSLSLGQLINLIKNSCSFFYGEETCDVQITGGEPTLDKDYLISLIKGLRKLNVERIGISTNGYLLDKALIKKLKALNIDHIKLDIKAYTRQLHIDYTGKDNVPVLKAARLLEECALSFYVRTIFTPDLMGFEEIEKIAKFIGSVNKNIPYKIYQFAPEQLGGKISRSPNDEEMRKAYAVAKNCLKNVEYYTTETAYRPDPYKCIEVRADELLERFKRIDEISKSVIKDWDMKYFTMSQILSLKEEGWSRNKA
jgi:pyruvate-formate lyase-activating enzyme